MAKLDLSIGSPLFSIIDKLLDMYLLLLQSVPIEARGDLALQVFEGWKVWQELINKSGAQLLKSMEGMEEVVKVAKKKDES